MNFSNSIKGTAAFIKAAVLYLICVHQQYQGHPRQNSIVGQELLIFTSNSPATVPCFRIYNYSVSFFFQFMFSLSSCRKLTIKLQPTYTIATCLRVGGPLFDIYIFFNFPFIFRVAADWLYS